MKKKIITVLAATLFFLVWRVLEVTVMQRDNGFFADGLVWIRLVPLVAAAALAFVFYRLGDGTISARRAASAVFFAAALAVAFESLTVLIDGDVYAYAFTVPAKNSLQYALVLKAVVAARISLICAILGVFAAAYLCFLGMSFVYGPRIKTKMFALSLGFAGWLWLKVLSAYVEKPVNAANSDSLVAMACAVVLGLAYSKIISCRARAASFGAASAAAYACFCYVSANALVTYIARLCGGASVADGMLGSFLLGVGALFAPALCGSDIIDTKEVADETENS